MPSPYAKTAKPTPQECKPEGLVQVRLTVATRDQLSAVARKNAVSIDEAVQAGLTALNSKCRPAYGLLSVDLVRSIDMLEASTAFMAQANFVLAECIVALQQDGLRKVGTHPIAEATKGGS